MKNCLFFSQIFFLCGEEQQQTKNNKTIERDFVFLILFVWFLCCCCYLVSLCERQLQQHAWQIKRRTDRRRPRLERHWLVGLLKGFSKKRGVTGLRDSVTKSTARWNIQLKPPLTRLVMCSAVHSGGATWSIERVNWSCCRNDYVKAGNSCWGMLIAKRKKK